MNLLQQFVVFLLGEKPKPSLVTIKNYKADIGQFINWFEKEFNLHFDPAKITPLIIQAYKKSRNLSESSIERHASSLRKFFSFLKNKEIISQDPLEKRILSAEARALEDPWMLRNFKSFLYDYKKSNLTIKNYVNDLKSFFLWFKEVTLAKYAWDVTDKNLLNKVNLSVLNEYRKRLIIAKFSPRTINRKLSSLRSYVGWAKSQGLIPSGRPELTSTSHFVIKSPPREEILSQAQNDKKAYSSFPPKRLAQQSLRGINFLFDALFIAPLARTLETTRYLFWKASGKRVFYKNVVLNSPQDPQHDNLMQNIKREFYAPLTISTRYLSLRKKIWHYLHYVRPNWYRRYHSYSLTHYLHFAILVVLSCIVGFGIYNDLFVNAQKGGAILGTTTEIAPRILAFQGKLTDSSNNPIAKPTTVLFSLYNDKNAPTSAFLWQEKDTVNPDSDGFFSVFLGKNTPIPDAAFSQNSLLFLGITVENSPELWPRQKLATVPFAGSAETLQGLEPITNTARVNNVVLALDSSGNLNIAGAKPHTFQAIGSQFILSGKVLSLTTLPGSNSDIEIVPDGMGRIDLAKPIHNSTNNNNLTSAVGAVEFDDNVAILATTSAQAALYISQNFTGALISASTSGTAKFSVENDGTGMFAGDLAVNGGSLTSSNTNFNLLDSSVTTLNIGGAATTLNLGMIDGTINVKSNLNISHDLSLSSLTSNGGILYTNESGKILQVSAGSSSDCLTGGTTPSFISCSKIFNQAESVGIGTTAPLFKLDVQDSQGATAAAQIYNTSTDTDADGLIVKLGNVNLTVDNANHFISFETSGIGIVGSIRGNGTGIQYQTSGVADFAEYFKKDPNQDISYGSVICLEDDGSAVPCDSNNGKIIGVASERPAFLGGKNLGDKSIAVGLVGQIETLATTRSGEIKAGDMLTASDIPGVAAKTTRAGQIIGRALEDLANLDESKVVGYYNPDNKEYRSKADFPDIPLKSNIVRVAKVPLLINVSWYDPSAYLAQNGDFVIESAGPNEYSISNSKNEALTNLAGFFQVIAANLHAGMVNTSEVITNALVVTSDSIIINGQNLKDYIVKTVKESGIINQESSVISPVINTDRISANIISPLGESLIVRLSSPSGQIHDSQFVIQNSSGSAVAQIDDQGNASFSGELQVNELLTNQLSANEATISGTLYANNILADSIQGLDAKVSSYLDLTSYSASLSSIPDLTAERGQFNQGLMVFGPTSLSDLSVAGDLSIGGTMFFTQNSLETLGVDLSLQSLRQGGLSIMAGLIYIDTQGNIKVQGDLFVTGKLAVNVISPLPTSDLVVSNASGSAVLSINQTGDVVASGSGTFAKLNFNLIAPVLAVSATEVIASSSAGVANITPYQSELTIRNPLVTNKSVIYITPVGTPSAQTPFLMRQVPSDTWLRQQDLDSNSSQVGSFTVGVQSPTNLPIPFNWLIIN